MLSAHIRSAIRVVALTMAVAAAVPACAANPVTGPEKPSTQHEPSQLPPGWEMVTESAARFDAGIEVNSEVQVVRDQTPAQIYTLCVTVVDDACNLSVDQPLLRELAGTGHDDPRARVYLSCSYTDCDQLSLARMAGEWDGWASAG